MKKALVIGGFFLVVTLCFGLANAQAVTTTITAYPEDVPDESLPRGIVGDAPTGWGDSCWQGAEPGIGNKCNYHVRQDADGNHWNELFGDDDVTVADVVSLSYWTKKGINLSATDDWWMSIYTKPEGDGDDAGSWYRSRLHGMYTDHVSNGEWNLWSTDSTESTQTGYELTFRDSTRGGAYMSLSDMAAGTTTRDYRTEKVMSITLQTNSGSNGFDGYVDGLTITLTNDRVGRVDFAAVPEPGTILLLLSGLTGLMMIRRRS